MHPSAYRFRHGSLARWPFKSVGFSDVSNACIDYYDCMKQSEDMLVEVEEDDVVVRELDVYVSDQVDLYLLQYMLRPANAPPLDVKHAQFKPKHKVLEVFAEHDAKQTGLLKLASTSVSSKTSLGIGVLSDDAIHITPLQEVLQMRPVFRNLPNSNRGEEQGADGSGTDDDEEQRGSSQRPVLQQVLLKKKESDRAQSARVQSYSHLVTQEENEAFRKLDTFSIEESQVIFDRMYALEEAETVNEAA